MLLDFYHHIKAPHFKARPLSALYASFTLRTLAISLVSVFTPIYIMELTGDFLWVLVFFAVYSLLVVFLSVPLGWVVSNIGFRRSVFAASLLLALEFFLLKEAGSNIWLLLAIPPVEAAKLLLYWLPFHLMYVEDGARKHFGQQVSVPTIIAQTIAAVAPFLGGLVISSFGFGAVFSLAILVVLTSSIPLFFMPHHNHGPYPSLKHFLKNTLRREYGRMFSAFWGRRAVAFVRGIVWPVFLFGISRNSFTEVGAITSAVLLVSALSTFLVGKVVDKRKKGPVLEVGALANAFIWAVKVFVKTPFQALVLDSANKIILGVQKVPFDTLTYEKARKRRHHIEFIVRREVLIHFGGFLTALLALGLWTLGVSINWLFVIAVLGSLASIEMAWAK